MITVKKVVKGILANKKKNFFFLLQESKQEQPFISLEIPNNLQNYVHFLPRSETNVLKRAQKATMLKFMFRIFMISYIL